MLIRKDVSLRDKCHYKTGGPAAWYAEPSRGGELRRVLEWASEKNIPFEIIGCGANLLISDEGCRELVICLSSFGRWAARDGALSVSCGAGLRLSELVDFTVRRGLKGLEKLSGIPGSVGGALAMNAGAYGAEIKDAVSSVSVMDASGAERELSPGEIGFCYRGSPGLRGLIVTGASFILEKGSSEALENDRAEILKKRREKQPLDRPSCGSVFKRPPSGYAGEFIEKCGLKGLRKGGAVISEKHANFILNDAGASSADIKWLMDEAARRVREEYGVELEPEVRLLGFG